MDGQAFCIYRLFVHTAVLINFCTDGMVLHFFSTFGVPNCCPLFLFLDKLNHRRTKSLALSLCCIVFSNIFLLECTLHYYHRPVTMWRVGDRELWSGGRPSMHVCLALLTPLFLLHAWCTQMGPSIEYLASFFLLETFNLIRGSSPPCMMS